jgi:gas vesicle protein
MKGLIKATFMFAAGALAGATAALLLDPKTAEKVRGQVKDFASEAKKRAQDYCEKVKEDISEAQSAAEASEKEA